MSRDATDLEVIVPKGPTTSLLFRGCRVGTAAGETVKSSVFDESKPAAINEMRCAEMIIEESCNQNVVYFDRAGVLEWPPGNKCATSWTRGGLYALRSESKMRNGSRWIHISVSRRNSDPSWDEMVKTKEDLIGKETDAVMVLPARKHHVNIQNHCFHWWKHLSGPTDVMPNPHELEWESAI